MATSGCQNYEENLGPFQINYEYLYYCTFKHQGYLFVFLVLIWIGYLMNLLGNTASNYFSPTLGSICVKLNLSYQLAGVTFLAFGNGAPDVFSSFASVAGNADVLVGVGAILGGSVFISCVVVGSISISCPSQVSKQAFLRDISFHILSITFLSIIGIVGRVPLLFAISLVVSYGLYCSLIICSSWNNKLRKIRSERPKTGLVGPQIQTAFWHKSNRPKSKINSTSDVNGFVTPLKKNEMNGQNAMQDNVLKENDTEGKDFNDENPYGYTFLIVDDTGNGKDGLETKKEDKSLKQSDNTNSNDEGDEGEITVNLSGGFMSPEFDADIYEDYIDEKTKQASNSILKPSSQNSIFTPESNSGAHKYIELKQATKKIDGDSILKNKFSSFDAILNSIPGNFNTGESGLMDSTKKNFFFSLSGSAPKDLTESLLPPTSSSRFSIDFGDNHSEESENKFGVYDDELSTGAYQGVDDEDSSAPSNYEFGDYTNTFSRTSSEQAISVGALLHKNAQAELSSFNTSIPVTRRSQYHTSIRALYWQQLLLRRRLQKSLWLTSWLVLPLYGKILAILDFPTVLMRDLTIPTVDKELWSKMYATLQPIASLVFITFVLGKSSVYVGALPLPIFMMFLGIGPSIFIFFTTHTSYPPHNKMFNTIWLLIAFFMCIFWIYFLAGELVTCLTALGRIFEISPAFLGLTLLAWGNSMGDFFSNLSLSRRGFGEMALGGCYGSPVFDILVGLGASLTYVCIRHYPTPYTLTLDTASYISLAFVYMSLLSTLVIVPLNGYRFTKLFGIYLLSLYGIYTFVQLIIIFMKTK